MTGTESNRPAAAGSTLPARGRTAPRGMALFGALWPGGDEPVLDDAVVLVDNGGVVAAYGPSSRVDVPDDVAVVRGAWLGPGIADAHVHLAFDGSADMFAGGLLAVRDLGAPLDDARAWRDPAGAPAVTVAGPVLTAPGGYPSRSWGARGFARFLGSPAEATRAVASLAAAEVDIVKVALEPADGLPVPSAEIVRAVVEAAHDAGLAVTCHALETAMVERALDAGVDELAHLPVQRLPTHLVAQLALDETPVVSTLRSLTRAGDEAAEGALGNARALVGAGVPLVYGTDVGEYGAVPGVDVDELTLLADTGLGPLGALRCATEAAAAAVRSSWYTGRVAVGDVAGLVVLDGDPLADPQHWRRPLAVVAGTRLVRA